MISPIGACFAIDKIHVDGDLIHWMYREKPDNDLDSGWRFLSGNEDDDYMSNEKNIGIYDVNTIANYDKAIVPYLNFPVGIEFKRNKDNTFKKINKAHIITTTSVLKYLAPALFLLLHFLNY